MRRTLSSLLLLLLLPAVALGCSSSAAPPPTDTGPQDSSDPGLRDKAAVEQLLKNWYRDFEAAKATPAELHPELERWIVAELRPQITAKLRSYVKHNQVIVAAPQSIAKVVVLQTTVDGDRATSRVCELNDYWTVDATTKAPVDTDVITFQTDWVAHREPGGWRLAASSNTKVLARGKGEEGIAPCAD
jgi:hypothetical protein